MPGGNRESSGGFDWSNPFRRIQPATAPVPFTGGSGITLPGVGSPFVMSPVGVLGADEPLGRGTGWRWRPPRRKDQ